MLELFVVGGFWFWALIAVEVIVLFSAIEKDSGLFATVSLAVFLCLLQFCGNTDIIGYISQNPFKAVAAIVAYFVIGTLVAIIKWWMYCRDRLETYKEVRNQFLLDQKHTGAITQPLKEQFEKSYEYRRGCEGYEKAPLISQNKGKFIRWSTFWFIVVIWSVINDFVMGVYKAIYRKLQKFLQSISDKIYADIDK